MGLKSECGRIDVVEGALGSRIASRCDGESIDAVAVSDDFLELIEMHPHLVLTSRDLGRICPALNNRGDNYCDAAVRARPRGYDKLVADRDFRVFGESFVNCNCSMGGLLEQQ